MQGCTKCGGTSPCTPSWLRKKFRSKVDNNNKCKPPLLKKIALSNFLDIFSKRIIAFLKKIPCQQLPMIRPIPWFQGLFLFSFQYLICLVILSLCILQFGFSWIGSFQSNDVPIHKLQIQFISFNWKYILSTKGFF